MNKLRFIRIFELRGLIHPIEATIIDLLDGIEEVLDGDSIRYKKDGITYFRYDLNINNIIYFNGILDNFGWSNGETREVLKYLLEKHLNITINKVI